MNTAAIRAEIAAAQAALARALAMLDEAQAPPAAAPTTLPLKSPQAFFDVMRRLAGGKLSQAQVDGLSAILLAGAKAALPLADMAYVIATPALETGMSFDAGKVENLNYSVNALLTKFSRDRISEAEARRLGRNDATGQKANQQGIANAIYGGEWGRANLGNTQPNDGWYFRGRSWPQLTGRKNYTKADQALGLNGDLLRDPSILARDDIAAAVLIQGLVGGWFTGVSLSRYLPRSGPASLDQFVQARRTVNGLDRAGDIADMALEIQRALEVGEYL